MTEPGTPAQVHIDVALLPEGEHESAKALERALSRLDDLAEEFHATVNLVVFALKQGQEASQEIREIRHTGEEAPSDTLRRERHLDIWKTMAGRNGAIVINGFWETTQRINKLLGRCPSLRGLVDFGKRDAGQAAFLTAFPDITPLRHSTAHPEHNILPEEMVRNSIKGSGPITGFEIKGDTTLTSVTDVLFVENGELNFCASMNGKLVKYSLSAGSLEVLRSVAASYGEMFEPVRWPR